MSDLFDKVTGDQDFFKKLRVKSPVLKGILNGKIEELLIKLMRETIADRFEELWQRISSLQTDFISQGEILYVDDLEKGCY